MTPQQKLVLSVSLVAAALIAGWVVLFQRQVLTPPMQGGARETIGSISQQLDAQSKQFDAQLEKFERDAQPSDEPIAE